MNKRSALPKLLLAILLPVMLIVTPVRAVDASPTRQEGPTYIVQAGDSLNSIALQFNVAAEEIQSVNAIADPNTLFIGQRLIIPGLEGISGVLTSQILPFGVSLTDLTRQRDLDLKDLALLNRLTSPTETIAGIKFIIPINEGQETLSPLANIAPGETALESAIRSSTSPWMVLENNHLNAFWEILPGETLYGVNPDDTGITGVPEINEISLNNVPIIQGETLQIIVSAAEPVTLSGNFNDEPLNFFTEDGEIYYSFHGIHALMEPGIYSLQVVAEGENSTARYFDQLVVLVAGGYGNQYLTVADEFIDPATIESEEAYFRPFIQQVTETRHWDGRFQYPVDEPWINGGFGLRRDYNNGEFFFYHTGMDFAIASASNWNIYAVGTGEVILAEELPTRGNTVLIDHGWGVFSVYLHLREFNVDAGDFVQPGDLLGLIGSTGRSTGPHLHLEVVVSGTPVNPATWLEQEFP